jgi:Tol biopolymer transport system component
MNSAITIGRTKRPTSWTRRSAVFFAAATLTSWGQPEVATLQSEVATKGWVLYAARSAQGDWDLFTCRPDGSAVKPLTQTAEYNEFSPQVSHDGRKLLYRRLPRTERIDGNQYGQQGELILANRDGSDAKVLGKAGDLPWASWSPEDSSLACLNIKGVSIVEVASRRVVRTLPRKGFFQQLTWSPDGQWLLGVANDFGTGWSIARMHATSGETAAINRVDCCTPDWFPDSRQVIFSWRPPGQKGNQGQGWTQLWRASADGASRQLVYGEDGRHVYGGHVSPDGQYVLFTGNVQENGDPGRAGAPMGLMRLNDGPIIGGQSTELRALHPKAKDGPVLTLPAGWEPCWTFSDPLENPVTSPASVPAPDTEPLRAELRNQGWLVFSAKGDAGDWDLFLMRPDGSARRRLTDTREFNEAGARFSPDGKQLLYYRMARSEPVDNNNYGTFDLILMNADGTGAVDYGKGFQWACWGPDGRQIACLAPQGIQIIDVTTRAAVRQLSRQGIVSQLVWSPDGKRFAGTANGLGQFWNVGCLDLESGSIHAVSETERYNCTPDWAPDSRHIVYARGIIPQRPGHAELWVADAEGSERRRLYAEAERHIYGACASPAGKHVLFTRSVEDLGQVPAIMMAVIRWPQPGQPTDGGSVPRLDLGAGWEPHWTSNEIFK